MSKTDSNEHLVTGKKGEEIACEFLKSLGYTIVGTNIRHGKGEIDLIVENEKFLVFVEVKTRKNNNFGTPESFVSKIKQKIISKTADW
jgi:putative endonuclease